MTSQTAVVLGAGGTLGAAISGALHRRGLDIVGVGRSETCPPELAASVPSANWVSADVGSDSLIDSLRDAVRSEVRMVVQAVGLPGGATLETVDPALFGVAVNLKLGGWIRAIRALEPQFVDGTRIVALGGHYGAEPSPHAPLAGATNAALANLVRQLATVHGPRGATVHLVAPGPVESERMQRIAEAASTRAGTSPDAVLDAYRNESPLGRLTTAAEVGWAVATLLDPEASALHGSTLWLDLGRRRGTF